MGKNDVEELTLNEMRYLHTPDLSVDLISSSRWSRITSLMNSYLFICLCRNDCLTIKQRISMKEKDFMIF